MKPIAPEYLATLFTSAEEAGVFIVTLVESLPMSDGEKLQLLREVHDSFVDDESAPAKSD